MSTLNDLQQLYVEVLLWFESFGIAEDFRKKFQQRLEAVGETIISDEGLSIREAAKLPQTTVLSPTAEAKFQRLKTWVNESANNSL